MSGMDRVRWAGRPSVRMCAYVRSNKECWEAALKAGWEWSLVLEDDAFYEHGAAA